MNIKNIPFLIAEISANHCGNFNLAKKLINTNLAI
jgi:sialic acid synthase SpsE|tara:strand:- start:64 stop:168 length:105 start_codon:yes stop_codon:yes gene_type:complete